MLVLGIDPATGVASPTAVALIDTEKAELINYWCIQPKQPTHQQRIAYIAQEVQYIIYRECPERIYIETFVMQGKSGMLLHQLIGALMAAAGYRHSPNRVGSVFNTTVKRIVGGSGGADKVVVAEGIKRILANPSHAHIDELIAKRNFDATDAIAIAIAGHLQETEGETEHEQAPKTRRKSKKSVRKKRVKKASRRLNARTNRRVRRRRSTLK